MYEDYTIYSYAHVRLLFLELHVSIRTSPRWKAPHSFSSIYIHANDNGAVHGAFRILQPQDNAYPSDKHAILCQQLSCLPSILSIHMLTDYQKGTS